MTLPSIGHEIGAFPVALAKARVIEYFDGERLVEMRSPAKDPYFKIWSNTDHESTRWLIVRLTDNDVARFLHRDITLRKIVTEPRDGHLYVVDFRGTTLSRVAFARPGDLPDADVPTDDSYYDDELAPEDGGYDASNEQLVLLNGAWDPEGLVKFGRRYTQTYAFNALFAVGADADANIFKDRLKERIFAGAGWSYVNAFETVVGMVEHERKPLFQSIQLSSPGAMRYRVEPATAARVRRAIRSVRESGEQLDKLFDALDGLIMEINRDAARMVDDGADTTEVAEFLGQPNVAVKEAAVRLAERLDIDPKRVWLVGGTDINSGELVRTYYRRLQDLIKAERVSGAVVV